MFPTIFNYKGKKISVSCDNGNYYIHYDNYYICHITIEYGKIFVYVSKDAKIEDGLKTIIILYAENLNVKFEMVLRYFEDVQF